MMDGPIDLAEALAAEARELFAQLPEGEVWDDERLYFTVSHGTLAVWVPRTNWNYALRDGHAYRYQMDGSGKVQITVYRERRETERFTVDLEDPGEAPRAPWLN